MNTPPPNPITHIPSNAFRCISGMSYMVLARGNGDEHPGPRDIVQVRLKGWQQDRTPINNPNYHNQPATFNMQQLMPGLAEALQVMTVGQILRVWIPEHLQTSEPFAPGLGTIVVDVELITFTRTEEPKHLPPEMQSPASGEMK